MPACVGVPEISPAGESVSPAGSEPALTVNVNGPAPPLAVTVSLYAAPVNAFGSVAGASTMAEPEIDTVAAGPAEMATGEFVQSRAICETTLSVPVPVGPTAATFTVNSVPPPVSPQLAPRITMSTV